MKEMPLQDLIKKYNLKEGDVVTCTIGHPDFPMVGLNYPIKELSQGWLGITNDLTNEQFMSYVSGIPRFITKEKKTQGMPLQDLIKEHDLKEGDEVTCTQREVGVMHEGENYPLKCVRGTLGVELKTFGYFYTGGKADFIVKEKHSNKLTEKTPHCELKHLWADGAIIQYYCKFNSKYFDCLYNKPAWGDPKSKFRVKPKEYSDTDMLDWMCLHSDKMHDLAFGLPSPTTREEITKEMNKPKL